jgi:multicomponent Na+:H+ antiporter subunit E
VKRISQLYYSVALALFFLMELFISSVRVALAVLSPSGKVRPTFLLMPLDASSDSEIMLTANLISLTPGTLTVDVAAGRSQLLIHSMFGADDPQAEIDAMKQGLERRVLQATRGERL